MARAPGVDMELDISRTCTASWPVLASGLHSFFVSIARFCSGPRHVDLHTGQLGKSLVGCSLVLLRMATRDQCLGMGRRDGLYMQPAQTEKKGLAIVKSGEVESIVLPASLRIACACTRNRATLRGNMCVHCPLSLVQCRPGTPGAGPPFALPTGPCSCRPSPRQTQQLPPQSRC